MLISGFVGYYGNDVEHICNRYGVKKLLSSVEKGVTIISDKYAIVTSSDYIVVNSANELKLISGWFDTEDANSMCVKISIGINLLIERDYWGVRTAYYYVMREGVFFSSDIRFLIALQLPDITRYDKNSIVECVTLGYIYHSDRTLFCNIRQVYPGGTLSFGKEGYSLSKITKRHNYGRFHDFGEALECFTETFDGVVREVVNHESRGGLLLSGGMDSTALALSASKNKEIPVMTFASASNADDVSYAKKLASYIKFPHSIFNFDESDAISNIPDFINAIENVEFKGIFDAFGGYAYYLLCKHLSKSSCRFVYPGEGADELLGGCYWPFTHSLGFFDLLKEKTKGTFVYNYIIERFPLFEDKTAYRECVFDLLQGSSLTNYHLSCIEHSAKAFNMINYPIYMTERLTDVIKDMKMEWLCDGNETKIILRSYLKPALKDASLLDLMKRKKLAMPSVVPVTFIDRLREIATASYSNTTQHPFYDCIGSDPLNYLIFDVLHKYFTQRPLDTSFNEEWMLDIERMVKKHEGVIHW